FLWVCGAAGVIVLSWLGLIVASLFYLVKTKPSPLLLSGILATGYLAVFQIIYVSGFALSSLTAIFAGLLLAEMARGGFVPKYQLNAQEGIQRTFFVIGLVLCLILSVLGGYWSTQRLLARFYFNQAVVQARSGENSLVVRENLNRTLSLEENDFYLRAMVEWGNLRLSELLTSQDLTPADLEREAGLAINTAVTSGKKAILWRGGGADNWFTLAQLYERLHGLQVAGALEEARAAYEAAGQLAPLDTGLLFNRSRFEESVGELNQAVNFVQVATELAPADFTLWLRLGVLKFKLRDWAGARAALESALTLNPNYADARYFLGLTYAELGLTDVALAEFNRLRVTNPDNQEIEQIIANLQAGLTPFAGLSEPVADQKIDKEN
ncbi:MAG: tetratricopeptide repeat protein, partial [Patescibacteria group bacterium]